MSEVNKKGAIMQVFWLLLAIVCMIFALIFWLSTDKKMLYQEETPIEVQAIEEVTAEKVTANKALGAFQQEVPPLELTKRKISLNNNHLWEFRGTAFMQKNAKMWTIELFRAKEEPVIISYLRLHHDQPDLFYTRLSGDEQEDMYVVFYKTFNKQSSAQEALADLSALGLPASVTPAVYQLKNYVKLVNEVGSDEGMSGFTKVRPVTVSAVPTPSVGASGGGYATPSRTYIPQMVEPAPRIVQHSQEMIRQAQGN